MTLIQRWKQTALHNKALVLTSLLVAFGTIFYAGAAAFQVWILEKSSETTSSQNSQLIWQADRIAKAMESSVDRSKAALDATIESFHLEQRAWVAVNFVDMPLMLDKPLLAKVTFINTGRTPAVRVTQVVGFDAEFKRIHELAEPNPKWFRQASIILPGLPATAPAEPRTKNPIDVLTQAGIDAINKGQVFIYVWGEIKYFDVFGAPHFTKFCGEYSPKAGLFGVCNFPFADAN